MCKCACCEAAGGGNTPHCVHPTVRVASQQHSVIRICLFPLCPPLTPTELPYGWEKIEDPQFGTYYVEWVNVCCAWRELAGLRLWNATAVLISLLSRFIIHGFSPTVFPLGFGIYSACIFKISCPWPSGEVLLIRSACWQKRKEEKVNNSKFRVEKVGGKKD